MRCAATSRSSAASATGSRRSVRSCASTSSPATTRSGRSPATSGAGSTPRRRRRTTTSASAPTTTLERRRLPDHQAQRVSAARRTAASRSTIATSSVPGAQGARRSARAQARVPAGVDRQHRRAMSYGSLSGAGGRGDQPRRRARRLLQNTGEGGISRPPPPGRRPHLADRHRLLRLPRRATATSTSTGCVDVVGAGARCARSRSS